MRTLLLLLCILTLPALPSVAQEEGGGEQSKYNRITFGLGQTLIGQGFDDQGNRSWRVLPTWVLDYDRELSSRWSLGVHTDVILESFEVHGFFGGEESEVIERKHPVAILLAPSFKPGKHAVYSIGLGSEISQISYFMTRLGFEYGFELPGDWELAPSATYDIKWNAYDSFSISLAVGKKF